MNVIMTTWIFSHYLLNKTYLYTITNAFSIHVLYPSFYFRLLFFRERLALVFLKRVTNLYRKPLSNFDVFDSLQCALQPYHWLLSFLKEPSYLHTYGEAAYCPGSQLVPIFHLSLNGVPKLAAVFKLSKIGASFENGLSQF